MRVWRCSTGERAQAVSRRCAGLGANDTQSVAGRVAPYIRSVIARRATNTRVPPVGAEVRSGPGGLRSRGTNGSVLVGFGPVRR
jgi:hypothetical protein